MFQQPRTSILILKYTTLYFYFLFCFLFSTSFLLSCSTTFHRPIQEFSLIPADTKLEKFPFAIKLLFEDIQYNVPIKMGNFRSDRVYNSLLAEKIVTRAARNVSDLVRSRRSDTRCTCIHRLHRCIGCSHGNRATDRETNMQQGRADVCVYVQQQQQQQQKPRPRGGSRLLENREGVGGAAKLRGCLQAAVKAI